MDDSRLPVWERSLNDLAAGLSPKNSIMGFDVGSKTIGIAISNPGLSIATPLETIKRTKFQADAEQIAKLVEEYHVGGFVIGLPMNMDGTAGPRVQASRAFAKNIHAALGIASAFWDERLSTAAVDRAMLEADLSRNKRAAAVDKLAASYILQGALDFLKMRGENDLDQ